MKYTEPGEYTLVYKAEDECGNTTEQIRNVIVESVEPTEERLLVTGGAEEVCAFEGPTYFTALTPVFTEPYTGNVAVKFTNLYTKVGDAEWVHHPTYEILNHNGEFTASDNWYVSGDIYLYDADYLWLNSEESTYVYENGDATRCAKWDSLEIWTKAGE